VKQGTSLHEAFPYWTLGRKWRCLLRRRNLADSVQLYNGSLVVQSTFTYLAVPCTFHSPDRPLALCAFFQFL
jgi:hypothetical protein